MENTNSNNESSNPVKKIITGIGWNASQLIVGKGVDFLIKLVLARLLLPSDFGIVAIATMFIGFIQVLNELGVGAALIQRKEEQITEGHYYTAFTTGIVWSIGLYIIFSLGIAPLLSYYYETPELKNIIPVISLSLISGSINLVHRVKLTRELNFRKISIINNLSTIFSGVLSIILALSGAGVWSLVFNSVASFVIAVPMYFSATKWKPKLKWKKSEFLDIFAFGAYTTLTNLASKILANVDYLVIGKLLGASMLGAYSLAFTLTETIRSNMMTMVNSVMYPIYGRNQDSPKQLISYYLKVTKFNCLIVFPILCVFVLYSKDVIYLFFGEKWEDSVYPLRILAIASFFHMFINGHSSLIRGMGRAKLELNMQLIKAFCFYIPMIWIGSVKWGITGTAYGVLVAKLMEVIFVQFILNRYLSLGFVKLFMALKDVLIAAIISSAISLGIYYLVNEFVLGIIVLILCYGTVAFFLMKDEFVSILRHFKKRKKINL